MDYSQSIVQLNNFPPEKYNVLVPVTTMQAASNLQRITVSEETADILGRELSDATGAEMYGRAQRKLRHIISNFGDADGARNTVDYIAQLTIEAIRAEYMTQYTRAMYEQRKKEEAGTKAGPQGHTNIILQKPQKIQEVFA